jgi:CrcB protein
MNTLYVILGAAIGAPARFAIDQYIHRFSRHPYGIFVVNILGSFLLGLTFGSSEKIHNLFAIGFAGAFTTWSTFMLDIFLAYELRRYKEAGLNLVLSLGVGLLAAWCGLQLAQ